MCIPTLSKFFAIAARNRATDAPQSTHGRKHFSKAPTMANNLWRKFYGKQPYHQLPAQPMGKARPRDDGRFQRRQRQDRRGAGGAQLPILHHQLHRRRGIDENLDFPRKADPDRSDLPHPMASCCYKRKRGPRMGPAGRQFGNRLALHGRRKQRHMERGKQFSIVDGQ